MTERLWAWAIGRKQCMLVNQTSWFLVTQHGIHQGSPQQEGSSGWNFWTQARASMARYPLLASLPPESYNCSQTLPPLPSLQNGMRTSHFSRESWRSNRQPSTDVKSLPRVCHTRSSRKAWEKKTISDLKCRILKLKIALKFWWMWSVCVVMPGDWVLDSTAQPAPPAGCH